MKIDVDNIKPSNLFRVYSSKSFNHQTKLNNNYESNLLNN